MGWGWGAPAPAGAGDGTADGAGAAPAVPPPAPPGVDDARGDTAFTDGGRGSEEASATWTLPSGWPCCATIAGPCILRAAQRSRSRAVMSLRKGLALIAALPKIWLTGVLGSARRTLVAPS